MRGEGNVVEPPGEASVVSEVSVMGWLGWALLVAGLLALFVVWDLIFCGGKYCKQFVDRL